MIIIKNGQPHHWRRLAVLPDGHGLPMATSFPMAKGSPAGALKRSGPLVAAHTCEPIVARERLTALCAVYVPSKIETCEPIVARATDDSNLPSQ